MRKIYPSLVHGFGLMGLKLEVILRSVQAVEDRSGPIHLRLGTVKQSLETAELVEPNRLKLGTFFQSLETLRLHFDLETLGHDLAVVMVEAGTMGSEVGTMSYCSGTMRFAVGTLAEIQMIEKYLRTLDLTSFLTMIRPVDS